MMATRTGERSRKFMWRCRDCSKRYTVRTGTIYAESLIPLCTSGAGRWPSSLLARMA